MACTKRPVASRAMSLDHAAVSMRNVVSYISVNSEYAEPCDASAAAWLLIICHQCFCPLPLLSCGLGTHIQTFQNLLDLHQRSTAVSCLADGNVQRHKHAATHGLDGVQSSQISQNTQFDPHSGLQHLANPPGSLPGMQASTEATPADQTHALVTCMVGLVAASASFCCCSHSDEAAGHGGMHPQGARRILAFQTSHPAGMLQAHASPEITDSFLSHGSFDTAVPWWRQQEQHAAADTATATIASLVTYSTSFYQTSGTPHPQDTSQNSQASGSQTAVPTESSGLQEAPVLPSTLSWILCSASPAAIAAILPILCDRIVLLSAASVSKSSTHGSAQNAAFQPRLATTLLRWEGYGMCETWMENLPEYLATSSGIQALVACISDRDSCGLTEPQHITCMMLLKHAILRASMLWTLLPCCHASRLGITTCAQNLVSLVLHVMISTLTTCDGFLWYFL